MVKASVLGSIGIALMAIILTVEVEASRGWNDRILGGKFAVPGQFPYQASIRNYIPDNRTTHLCGGVLISDQIVLSTAYCTREWFSLPKNVAVRVGEHTDDIDRPTRIYATSRIINHPNFDFNRQNDISVIKTVEKILFTNRIQPARLPTSMAAAGTVATISGWGKTNVSIYFVRKTGFANLALLLSYYSHRTRIYHTCHITYDTKIRL